MKFTWYHTSYPALIEVVMVSFWRQSFLLGRHPFPGVAAKEVYVSWFCAWAQNSLLWSRNAIARGKPVRNTISTLSISSKRARDSIHLDFVGEKEGVPSLLVCGMWQGWKGKGKSGRAPWPCPHYLSAQGCALQTKNTAVSLYSLTVPGARGCMWQEVAFPPFFFPRLFTLKFPALAHRQCHYWDIKGASSPLLVLMQDGPCLALFWAVMAAEISRGKYLV